MMRYALAITTSLLALLIILVTAQPNAVIEESHPSNQMCQPTSHQIVIGRWHSYVWRWDCHPVGQGDR